MGGRKFVWMEPSCNSSWIHRPGAAATWHRPPPAASTPRCYYPFGIPARSSRCTATLDEGWIPLLRPDVGSAQGHVQRWLQSAIWKIPHMTRSASTTRITSCLSAGRKARPARRTCGASGCSQSTHTASRQASINLGRAPPLSSSWSMQIASEQC